jgi:phosphonate transport system permease protein
VKLRIPGLAIFGVGLVTLGLISRYLGLFSVDYRSSAGDLSEYFSRFQHPRLELVPECLLQMGMTLMMGIVSTFLALLIGLAGVPFALRSLGYRPFTVGLFRGLFSFLRAVPDSVFAILFLMTVGIGPQGGVIALALHSGGFMGKSLVDVIERLPSDKLRGVQACGAKRSQVFAYAIAPNVLPEIGNLALYTLDRNVRTAAVLGIIGSGGIGLMLKMSLDMYRYRDAATSLLILTMTILLLEILSDRFRKRILAA